MYSLLCRAVIYIRLLCVTGKLIEFMYNVIINDFIMYLFLLRCSFKRIRYKRMTSLHISCVITTEKNEYPHRTQYSTSINMFPMASVFGLMTLATGMVEM